jgi:hypothetical protein
MPDIDAEAAGILIEECGVAALVAVAGSAIEDQLAPRAPGRRHPVAMVLGAVAAFIVAWMWWAW